MAQETILSGIQPSGNGKLHIGNYFGALQHFVKLQYKHRCFFGIVDYHSITTKYSPPEKQAQVMETAREFIAAGLDPKKCTLFIQSYIPEHMELYYIFNTITPFSSLKNMIQFQEKTGLNELKKNNDEKITLNIETLEQRYQEEFSHGESGKRNQLIDKINREILRLHNKNKLQEDFVIARANMGLVT